MIEQPKNYSEMLKRIFLSSLAVGIICTLSLAYMSPKINQFIHFSSKRLDLGPITLPIVAVVIPFFVALVSRMVTLHDVISDIFKIRAKFDVEQILLPLAKGVNHNIDPEYIRRIQNKRFDLMRDTFYKYAPNVDNSVINSQYVATALDRWAWFWSFTEPTIILLVSALIAWWQIGIKYSSLYFGAIIAFVIVAMFIYSSCKRAAKYEVDDILNDHKRKIEIKGVFNAL